jgi:hypothetical protein
MYGVKIDNGSISADNNKAVYNIGDTISLMLQVDGDDTATIGDTIPVQVRDIFGNIIVSLIAERLNDIYVVEWTIPLMLHKLYNALGAPDLPTSPLFYYLTDNWIFPDTTELNFDFLVEKNVEEAVIDNCEYNITINGVLSSTNETSEAHILRFCSPLVSFYTTVDDVKNVLIDELSAIDDFIIARDIYALSRQVDLHMRPDVIYRQAQYDLAVRMYIKYYVARQHLIFLLNINAESKELDMLKYSKNSGDPERALESIDALITKYSYIILAGGKDTPFIPKTFTKGIMDPNRVDANRAGLDTSDPYPWVNTSTSSSVVNINGNKVELRGTRTVSFLKNRVSFPNVYLRSEGVS